MRNPMANLVSGTACTAAVSCLASHRSGESSYTKAPLRRRRRGAFTLTEVIIVIAVLGMMLGLLLPVLAGVRSSGRAIQCQSNLRQMSRAAELYAAKYRAYPAALRYDNTGGVFKQIEWDWVSTLSGQLIGPGALWQFTDDPDHVMQCPQYHGNPGSPADPFTGYNYSTYIGGEQPFSPNPAMTQVLDGAAPTQIRRPSMTAMFGLGGRATGTNKFMRSPVHHQHSQMQNLPLSALYSGGQAFRYRGSTFVVYADGRIGSVEQPCEGPHATPQLLQQFMGFPRNGFLSDDAIAYAP